MGTGLFIVALFILFTTTTILSTTRFHGYTTRINKDFLLLKLIPCTNIIVIKILKQRFR